MGLFRRKGSRPARLEIPRASEILFPDVAVHVAYADELAQLAQNAADVATALPADAGHELIAALVAHWWPESSTDEQLLGPVSRGVRLGLSYATMEQHQGRAVAGEVHPWMHTGIALQTMHMPDELKARDENLPWRCAYAIRAGYYLGRVGDQAIPELVANADWA